MANVIIHNISDRTGEQAVAVNVGLVKIRPGKHQFIPTESINAKTWHLHGKLIWIGDLPPSLIKKKILPEQASYMGREEVSSYLMGLSIETLIHLTKQVTPQINVRNDAPHRRYVYALRAACFSDEYVLDPESFFWLGKWSKLPNGDFIEV